MVCTVFRKTGNGNGVPVASGVSIEEAVQIIQSSTVEHWVFYQGTSVLATLN